MVASEDVTSSEFNGRYDVVTLRMAVGGLISCGAMSIVGIVLLHCLEKSAPASLGHIATGVAGALSMCFGQLFQPKRG